MAFAAVVGARAVRHFDEPQAAAKPADEPEANRHAPPKKTKKDDAAAQRSEAAPLAREPTPPSTLGRLARHFFFVTVAYAAAFSGNSPPVKGVRRPLVLFFDCNVNGNDAACAKRVRYMAKVSHRTQLFKARRVLGLEKRATLEDAKKARKKIALEFHPDKSDHPDANEIFSRAEAAYDILAADFKAAAKKRPAAADNAEL